MPPICMHCFAWPHQRQHPGWASAWRASHHSRGRIPATYAQLFGSDCEEANARPLRTKPRPHRKRFLWCRCCCAQGPHVCFFTIAAKELHICGGHSPATVHTHGRHIDSKEALHNKRLHLHPRCTSNWMIHPICTRRAFAPCPCKGGLPEILCHAKLT